MEAIDISRPKLVESAIYVLSATLVIGLARAVFGINLSAIDVDPLLLYGLLFGFNALMGLLLYKIWSGMNWARVVYALLFFLGLFKTVPALVITLNLSMIAGLLSGALVTLQLVAVLLLFHSSSNAWFRSAKL